MPSKHSLLFPPSGSDRWAVCTASAHLCAEAIQTAPDEYQNEGTKAHKAAEFFLLRSLALNTIVDIPNQIEIKGELIELSATVQRSITQYIKTVFFYRDTIEGAQIKVETFKSHPVLTQLAGSADCVVFNKSILVIIDFKSGVGKAVDPASRQLLCYADIWRTTQSEIETVVCQPADYRSDELFISNYYGIGEFQEQLSEIIDAYNHILQNDTEFKQGEHCRFCIAAPNCPVVAQSLVSLQGEISADQMPLLEQAYKIVCAEESIKKAIKQARRIVFEAAVRGEEIEGFKLVNSYGNRKWRNERIVVSHLKDMGVPNEVIYETKVKSPNQLKKFVSKNFLEMNVERPFRGLLLVPNSDTRSRVDVSDFEDLTK